MEALKDIPIRELAPGFLARLVHGNQATLSVVEIKKGSTLPAHQHVHEQITYVLQGEMDMVIGGKKYSFTPGMVHVIPSNTPHNATALTDVVVVDVFSPVREDYK